MRLANRQHPLHLQVTRIQNGKFLVSQNGHNQDVMQSSCDETTTATTTVAPVVFPSCEAIPTDNAGPTLLGNRFLLVGPAEGSALYRCVDVQNGQQLVAKVVSKFHTKT
uniref:TRIB2_0 protein n=1 Tax=Fopius arisanus TaxID=64838 RepID=A0A0C9R441_9HYME